MNQNQRPSVSGSEATGLCAGDVTQARAIGVGGCNPIDWWDARRRIPNRSGSLAGATCFGGNLLAGLR